jgi:hypothetical protein
VSKLGKTTRDIFSATADRVGATPKTANELPAATTEPPYVKATVVLRTNQVVYLDRVCADIRAKSGAAIARAELIRALIDALADGGLNVTSARNEAELRALFSRKLKA